MHKGLRGGGSFSVPYRRRIEGASIVKIPTNGGGSQDVDSKDRVGSHCLARTLELMAAAPFRCVICLVWFTAFICKSGLVWTILLHFYVLGHMLENGG